MSVEHPRWIRRALPRYFLAWRAGWTGPTAHTMTPTDYLDKQNAFRYAFAAAWLFCPETLEYRDCVFLADRFNSDIIDSWFRKFNGDQEQVEAMVNHTEVYHVFDHTDLDDHEEDVEALALAMGECWQGVLAARYPLRSVTVELRDDSDGADGPTITVWTDHHQKRNRPDSGRGAI